MLNSQSGFDAQRPKDVRASAVSHITMVVRTAVSSAVRRQESAEKIADDLERALGPDRPDAERVLCSLAALRTRRIITRSVLQYVADAVLSVMDDPEFFRYAFSGRRELSSDAQERVALMDVRIVDALRPLLSTKFRKAYPDAYRDHFELSPVPLDAPKEVVAAGARRWFHLRAARLNTLLRPWKESFFSSRDISACGFPEYLPGFRDELVRALYDDYLKWVLSEANRERAAIVAGAGASSAKRVRDDFTVWEKAYFS